ncbi:MAG: STAS domain-containing protein [Pseudomonadales bacterium]|nr:STAS domain-containing protein [Pseudomonadales bacterium]
MSEASARLSVGAGDTITVSGLLSVDTVARYRDEGVDLMDDVPTVAFDLSACEVKGSAAIALLISWQRAAIRLGKDIEFRNAPENLLAIAEACGVDHIIPFAS